MEEDLEDQEEDRWIQISLQSLDNMEIAKYFNYQPRFNGVFFQEIIYLE